MGTSSQIPLKYGLVNIGPQLTRIRSIKGEADNSFLLSMLKVPFNKDRLLSMNAGSAMPFIGLTGLGTFTFNSPNLSEQSKIGLLFQNIDNLITLHQLN